MVKSIQMFEASDGTTHKTEQAALCHELVQLLMQSKDMTSASASAVVNRIVENEGFRNDRDWETFESI